MTKEENEMLLALDREFAKKKLESLRKNLNFGISPLGVPPMPSDNPHWGRCEIETQPGNSRITENYWGTTEWPSEMEKKKYKEYLKNWRQGQ